MGVRCTQRELHEIFIESEYFLIMDIYIAVYRFDSAAAAIVVLIALPDSPQNLSAIVCDCDIRKTNCEYIGKAFQSCCMQGKKPHTKALHVQYIRWQAEN